MKFREQLELDKKKLEKMPDTKTKLVFIWDYYKPFILVVGFFLVVFGLSAISNFGKQDNCMYAVLLNTDALIEETDSAVFDRLLDEAGYERNNKKVDINDTLSLGISHNEEEDVETMQILTALFTITDLDFFAGPKDTFLLYGENDAFADLSVLIESNIIDRYKEDAVYCENTKGENLLIGITLHPGSVLHKAGYYHGDIVIGACASGANLEEAILVVKQILQN